MHNYHSAFCWMSVHTKITVYLHEHEWQIVLYKKPTSQSNEVILQLGVQSSISVFGGELQPPYQVRHYINL